jgi:hypothetical protein
MTTEAITPLRQRMIEGGQLAVDVLAVSAAGSPRQQRPRPRAPWGGIREIEGVPPPRGVGRAQHR